jgi:hypothetical protein
MRRGKPPLPYTHPPTDAGEGRDPGQPSDGTAVRDFAGLPRAGACSSVAIALTSSIGPSSRATGTRWRSRPAGRLSGSPSWRNGSRCAASDDIRHGRGALARRHRARLPSAISRVDPQGVRGPALLRQGLARADCLARRAGALVGPRGAGPTRWPSTTAACAWFGGRGGLVFAASPQGATRAASASRRRRPALAAVRGAWAWPGRRLAVLFGPGGFEQARPGERAWGALAAAPTAGLPAVRGGRGGGGAPAGRGRGLARLAASHGDRAGTTARRPLRRLRGAFATDRLGPDGDVTRLRAGLARPGGGAGRRCWLANPRAACCRARGTAGLVRAASSSRAGRPPRPGDARGASGWSSRRRRGCAPSADGACRASSRSRTACRRAHARRRDGLDRPAAQRAAVVALARRPGAEAGRPTSGTGGARAQGGGVWAPARNDYVDAVGAPRPAPGARPRGPLVHAVAVGRERRRSDGNLGDRRSPRARRRSRRRGGRLPGPPARWGSAVAPDGDVWSGPAGHGPGARTPSSPAGPEARPPRPRAVRHRGRLGRGVWVAHASRQRMSRLTNAVRAAEV